MWERFDQALKEKGLTQAGIAAERGWAKNRITKWKEKPENLSVMDAAELARAVGVSLAYLVDDEYSVRLSEGVPITADEEAVLGIFRGSKLSVGDFSARVFPPPPPVRKRRKSPRKRNRG